MYLIFDTETTGLPKSWNAPITDTDNWPRCVQIAWQLHDEMGIVLEHNDFLIKPDNFNIPYDAERIHGISTELAEEQGISLDEGLQLFNEALEKTTFIVGQNLNFDLNIMGCEFHRLGVENKLTSLPILDTCTEKTAFMCQIPGGRGGKFKLPTLTELHTHLFGAGFGEAHNATADVEATTRCFLELIRLREFTKEQLDVDASYFKNFSEANPKPIQFIGLKHINLKKESDKIRKRLEKLKNTATTKSTSDGLAALENVQFSHLHNHTQFSVLQSTMQIGNIVKAAAKDNMPAVAMTDTANMMASFHFVSAILNHNKTAETPMKPIVGCEFNVCEDHKNKSQKDNGYQVVLLAKNKKGYHNLAKMSSIAFVDGFYYVPRIDREIIKKYKEDIIVLTGNLFGEVPSKILNLGEKQAEDALLWWKEEFKDDFYIELMRHNQQDEKIVNETLLKFSKNHDIKIVATNNTFYLEQKDSNAHDILLCVKDGEKQATPKGKGRGYRYGLPNDEYYFKSTAEMKALFADLPEAIINIQEIVDKIEIFTLARDVLLPAFDIPDEFKDVKDEEDEGKRGENNFLKHLTFVGAKKRYGEITESIKERLDFELSVIEKTGYPGYFLIVEDFIREARNMDVAVGPGRGSAAGSVVAFCLWITNIDPIKYDLLFERFLNPERVSMPDIDIDFDDEGRGRVMDYVINKYGANQVAQIITYGTMAAKSSIRDTARVLDLPLFEADKIAKLIPLIKLKNIFGEDAKSKGKVAGLRAEEKQLVEELKNISYGSDLAAETINKATILEGSVRNTGIHACGVIITPSDITNYVPVALAKDSDMYVTQFDNSVVESAGLLKMDFLGLKTLTLIKDTVKIVKAKHNVDLDPENFPLDDEKTYELFQKGETVGIFQYESPGMQKHMRSLKPTVFADLIAMNALYRPGPMEYIPSFINRKHGTEDIEYDLPAMEEYLAETYGITVYQEQVMLLSQKLADFTKGEADVLRKAMGKKQIAVLDKMKPKFVEQAAANGHDAEKLEKIWKDWEAFASYAFNKSHSTCYAWIAYQTAYLKAHYPAEYMASVLSNNMNDIKSVSFFMEECKRMGLAVLGPDLNESYLKFSVNNEGAVRFGMAAVKGVGASAVRAIIKERKENGNYTSIFDLAKRVDLRAANKKSFDSLIKAGAFDSFSDTHRAQYFAVDEKGMTFLERSMKFGSKYQENENSAQVSMFGEASNIQFPEPDIPACETWGNMELLSQEKEVIGIYISAHPLDDFKNEMIFCNATLKHFKEDLSKYEGVNLTFAAIITDVQHRVSKAGKGWAMFTMEDYGDSNEFRIFGEDYLRMKHFLTPNSFLFVRCTIQPGWTNKEGIKGEPRLKFTDFKLLHDIMDELCKKVTIRIQLQEIKEDTILNLETILKNNPGKQSLNFTIWDAKEKIEVSLPSRNTKVKISNELLATLKSQQINFKLN
ncbi:MULTISPECIES: DNA polymerase III subunit alpha [unclassified Polaribacter]|jgi:DNA polymerase-3 subunit alpha|uniref:DNA polymerase III subunit alpha n=1 Tax=unclassified Polaribacter TaxID=196858 RepID=UPI00052BB02A|nr:MULTISPECIES: DNA polymerase III subunit alpha [unclassified Polaribacter]KGL59569.1 DNA polymerase III subunit alpha [Polaribacter sp. Hel1_33_49]MBT3741048.1 DNA polymerase III subunit alpha [Polaribacter sp.]MDG1194067.1 DNA polymerase III subunit alpha [Polaribacter sp.]MDG1402763.1 DNA polymerase III subunit alpha [Polaribacter sp.]PKV64062.1 DNA polymerase III alpha subunit [Polaribacter sp. Hel1_33_96]